jgi:hypothetical protein
MIYSVSPRRRAMLRRLGIEARPLPWGMLGFAAAASFFAVYSAITTFALIDYAQAERAQAEASSGLGCDGDADCETKFGTAHTYAFPGARLIGLRCGANKVTLWATEEDEFPATGCKTIEGL